MVSSDRERTKDSEGRGPSVNPRHASTICGRVVRMTSAIVVEGLRKSFGEVEALAGVDLEVEQGTVFGLLGPNGAGKTTTVRVLATVIAPDGGRAEVLGHDVVREPDTVRRRIGLAGQFAAVDPNLTGRENLQMVGDLEPAAPSADRAAGRRAPRPVPALRRRRPTRPHVLRRHAPTVGHRRLVDGQAARAVPRRADHRARPAEPQRALGDRSASSSRTAPRSF